MRLQLEELEEDIGKDDEEEEGGVRRGADEEDTATASSAVARRKSPPLARSETFHGRVAAAWLDFRARVIHSMLIVLCVFYLRITILLFSALPCSLTADPAAPADSLAEPTQSLILDADGQTKCFSGEHAVALPFISLLLLLYTAGLPLGCFILLTRAFADEQTGGVIGRMWKRWACLRGKRAEAERRKARASEMQMTLANGRQHAWPQQSPQQPNESDPGAVRPPSAEADRSVRTAGNVRRALGPTTNKTNRIAPSNDEANEEGGEKSNDSLTVRIPLAASEQRPPSTAHEDQPPPLQKVSTLSVEQSAAALRTQLRRELRYGFLFLSYREATFATGPLLLLSSCCVAAISVFTDPSSDGDAASSRLRLFLFGLLWIVQTLLIAHYLPYHSLMSNGKEVALGLGALAHTILMLGLQSGAEGSGYFIGLLILFALVAAVLFLRQAWIKRHKPNWTRQKTQWMHALRMDAADAAVDQAATEDAAALEFKACAADDGSKGEEEAEVADQSKMRGEGNAADHPASPSRLYELQGSMLPEGAAMDLHSPSAASSSDVGGSSLPDGSRPPTADLAAVRPGSSSGVSIRVGTPSGLGGTSGRVRWSASPLYLPDPDEDAEGGVTGGGKPDLSLLVPPRSPMQPRSPASGSASPSASGLLASTAGGRSPRRISGAVQLMPLHHRRTASAATAATVKIHLPPIVSAPVSIERPASAEPAALSSTSAAAAATTDAVHSAEADHESSAAPLIPGALPPLRKPSRILLLPVPRFAAAASPPSSLLSPHPNLSAVAESVAVIDAPPTVAVNSSSDPPTSVLLHRSPSLLDVDGVLDEFEQQQVNQAHTTNDRDELERSKQMQRVRREKEERMRTRQEETAATAAAGAAAVGAATEQSTAEDIQFPSASSPPVPNVAAEDSHAAAAAAASTSESAVAGTAEHDGDE
jgi:hypothetical protein